MRAGCRALAALLLAVVALVALAPRAEAQAADQPTVSVDRSSIRPGESVVVTLTGWRSEVVTLSVCGNQAARGSVDCNMVASEGIRRNRDGSTTQRDFVVLAPAMTCPCVLRASTATNDEIAIAPIDLIGHPTGPILLPKVNDGVQVSVRAARAQRGFLAALRGSLGGPTAYDVTITVRNASTLQLDHVVVSGVARRSGRGDVTKLELPLPGPLGPGRTWTHTVRSTVPAPVLGSFSWEVAASGGGPTATATTDVRNRPIALIALVLVLLADLAAIVWRRLAKRRAQQDEDELDDDPLDDGTDPTVPLEDLPGWGGRRGAGVRVGLTA